MSFPHSLRGISKRRRWSILWTVKSPRRVCASEVTTRAYGRGCAAPVPRPAESPGAMPLGAPPAGRAGPETGPALGPGRAGVGPVVVEEGLAQAARRPAAASAETARLVIRICSCGEALGNASSRGGSGPCEYYRTHAGIQALSGTLRREPTAAS